MGDKGWEHRLVAFNTATESTNRMHDDTVAAAYGFRGGLVPGVDVWAYLTNPCVQRWGTDFLERGAMDVRLLRPVYDGEPVVARLEEDGTLHCLGPDGDVRAQGTASLVDDLPAVAALGVAGVPDPVPPAAADLLTPGTVLGTLRLHHRAEPAKQYLADVRETHDVYEGGSICHPGFLARQANYVLSHTVRLGPWIHVQTRAHHHGVVCDGAFLEVRGVVADEREHKGHRFVDVDVTITADGELVWSAFHTAIWQPRQERAASA